ncbi:flavin reductase family protein [Actinoplanes sp. NPDC026619]|uniref:flavin reductase family protein n=1 Tax=Actinoplanes sp. NPDC026619 TaxID=3155798 RepID=UPI0033F8FC03
MSGVRVFDPGNPREFRTVLARFATGVAVVTAATDDGQAVGMTVNSFSAVSLDPPLVLFCVNRASQLHPVFAGAQAFAVHILAQARLPLSRRFARPGLDRFGGVRVGAGRQGVPLLDEGVLAVLECLGERTVPAGDHDIVLGRVERAVLSPYADADPLIYYGGAYRSLVPGADDWATAVQ